MPLLLEERPHAIPLTLRVPIRHTQNVMIFAPQVPTWCTHDQYVKILKDLVEFPAHQKQFLPAPEAW